MRQARRGRPSPAIRRSTRRTPADTTRTCRNEPLRPNLPQILVIIFNLVQTRTIRTLHLPICLFVGKRSFGLLMYSWLLVFQTDAVQYLVAYTRSWILLLLTGVYNLLYRSLMIALFVLRLLLLCYCKKHKLYAQAHGTFQRNMFIDKCTYFTVSCLNVSCVKRLCNI